MNERRNVENLGEWMAYLQDGGLDRPLDAVPFDTLRFEACPVACGRVLACVRDGSLEPLEGYKLVALLGDIESENAGADRAYEIFADLVAALIHQKPTDPKSESLEELSKWLSSAPRKTRTCALLVVLSLHLWNRDEIHVDKPYYTLRKAVLGDWQSIFSLPSA